MWDGHFLLPTSSSEDGRSQNMKQTKSNDERSKSGHSVRVHINDDDDRVTSCVKMRIANNKKKKVQKCAPRESGSCGTFANEPGDRDCVREEASWPRNTISPETLFVSLFRSVIRGRGEDTTPSEAEAQRTKLSTSTKLSHSFTSRHANCHRSGSGFVVVVLSNAPYDTPHIATCCLPTHQRLPLSR